MRIADLAEFIQIPDGVGAIEFSGISNNSSKVKPGDLFIAVPGYKTNGILFLEEAFNRGACAVVAEQASIESYNQLPIIPVANIRKTQGLIAGHYYHWPARQLRVIGVTGTNGKTTVTHLIEHMFRTDEREVGLIGTVWTSDGKTKERSERTTPDSIDLQRLLAGMVQNGVKTVVMEVSSHALAQERVAGIDFDVAVITNVTHDHFDFHHNYQNYFQSKLSLFKGLNASPGKLRYAVANKNDPSFLKITEVCGVPVVGYGATNDASVWLQKAERQGFLNTLHLKIFDEECQVTTGLPGAFNIYNILAAVTVCFKEGLSIEHIEKAIADFPGVPGRYQEIFCGQPFRVMVDFAHNPAALENILKMAKENTKGRRIIVFGCEGEKDRLKRPLMGKIAASNSDVAILTVDNIHHENVEQIFNDVLHDLPPLERSKMIVEPDRGQAIKKAIELAKPNDFLIVAGKGHEEFLVNGSQQLHFNDAEVIKEFLENKSTS
jgi:UDP-N-acetylmuramoyl-L-alanyl-D-glutamate--2,6-diaminopimelate ligase